MTTVKIMGANQSKAGYKFFDEACRGANDHLRIQDMVDKLHDSDHLELWGNFVWGDGTLDINGASNVATGGIKRLHIKNYGTISSAYANPVFRIGNSYALQYSEIDVGNVVKTGTARATGSKAVLAIDGQHNVIRFGQLRDWQYGVDVEVPDVKSFVNNRITGNLIANPHYAIHMNATSVGLLNRAELNYWKINWISEPYTKGIYLQANAIGNIFETQTQTTQTGAYLIWDDVGYCLYILGFIDYKAGIDPTYEFAGSKIHLSQWFVAEDTEFQIPRLIPSYPDSPRIDRWGQSYGSLLGDWTVQAATFAWDPVTYKINKRALKITANGAWSAALNTIASPTSYQGKVLTLGAWCMATSGNDKDQVLAITDDVSGNYSGVIAKDDAWHWTTVTRTVDAAATEVTAEARANHSADSDTDDVLRIDGAILVEGDFCPPTGIGPAGYRYQSIQSTKLDLSGAATDAEVYHAVSNATLLGYKILYTEASSADAGVVIRIGRYQNGVALDDDYFDSETSESSKALGYAKSVNFGNLTQSSIAVGDTITVGTAGGKVGTGEVIVWLYLHTRSPE